MLEVLEVFGERNHPYGLITKSALIELDIDLIAPMAVKGLACAVITITTLDGPLFAGDLYNNAAFVIKN